MAVEEARKQFAELADWLLPQCRPEEVLLLSYYGEDSDFVRINQSRVRQVGHVTQQDVHLTLIHGQRSVEASCNLGANSTADRARLTEQLADLRALLQIVPDDPFLRYSTATTTVSESAPHVLPEAPVAVANLLELAGDLDLVGIWASGTQYYGFANSFGQRHWYDTGSFNLDSSVHLPNGRAVKLSHAGQNWVPDEMGHKLSQTRRWAELLSMPSKALTAGGYRTYLAPTALTDLIGIAAYGGFSRRAIETRRSPLMGLYLHGRNLNAQVSLREARGTGFLPRFSTAGFALPGSVSLVNAGMPKELLIDRRSASEFKAEINTDFEAARSLSMDPGQLPADSILQSLGTGLYINNLWYTNLSDLQNCRITGSTRFACFWVEDGRFIAPLATSRFDDSLYNLLGDQLLGLTDRCECLLSPGTYGSRSGASMRLPGALLERMQFVM